MPSQSGAADGIRGPAEHQVRDQIVASAIDHFRRYGYEKTTITDLAAAIGISKAYIYKFFDSKQAIGEVVSAQVMERIVVAARDAAASAASAADRIRRLFTSVTASLVQLHGADRNVFDILSRAAVEKWCCNRVLHEQIESCLRTILVAGRESGEFERKTPLDELSRAISRSLNACVHPLMLVQDPGGAVEAEGEIVAMVLRSLAP